VVQGFIDAKDGAGRLVIRGEGSGRIDDERNGLDVMMLRRLVMGLFVVGLMGCGPRSDIAVAESFSYDDWSDVLSRFVDESGRVDYEALATDRVALDRFVAAIQSTGPTSRPELFQNDDERLAYYINSYNALVFEGVLSRGPEKVSVWRGGLISGYKFFAAMKVTIDGKKTSLKKLEDKVIREGFKDPRIHAALNCASIDCPRLPQKPFDPGNLEADLDAAMQEFVGSTNHVRLDEASGVVYLSKIFDWFRDDFLDDEREAGTEKPNLIDYVNRFRADAPPIPRDYAVRFLEYDKRLNRLLASDGS